MSYIFAHGRTLKGTGRIQASKIGFYIGRRSLVFMLSMFIGVLSLIYLVNFNGNATKGYELTRLEFQRDNLMNIREQNNLDLSRSQSLDYIRDSAKVQGMVKISEIIYYDGETAVAYNK